MRIEGAGTVVAFMEFKQARFSYPGRVPVVDGVDWQVGAGEFHCLLGRSGCGKTTLLKLAAGLLRPQSGHVFLRGSEVAAPGPQLGFMFQAPTLLPWRTTLDPVMLPLEIVEPYRSQLRGRRREFEERARRLLATVGLAGYENQFPWQLSGGMQQRASICRALIHEPKMLLLDEPFGALDAFTREELWNVLRDLWRARRFNVILVTHDLREAVYLADTVYVMSRRPGRILARRDIDLPRPRDLPITYGEPFTRIVLELRERIGAIRGQDVQGVGGDAGGNGERR